MPIVVACPSCQAKLTAPDAAAGKRVKCARCQTLIPIPESAPGYDVVEDVPPSAKPTVSVAARQVDTVESRVVRPAKARRPVDVDEKDERPLRKPAREEDEDDEEETPRAHRRRDDEEDEAPVKKRRRDVNDDDDEATPRARRRDEDDEAPVKKRRRDDDEDEPAPKKKRSAMPLIIVGALVGLLILGGVLALWSGI